MAKNKAFVRYANNKAVPGSLIVRKKAPAVGVWKEIPYDLCCDAISPCPQPNYGDWQLVTGGVAGDGVVLVDNTDPGDCPAFTFVGPNDSEGEGWVYLTKYYPATTCLQINYQWTTFDDAGPNPPVHDRPVYWGSATQPTGEPGDITSKVDASPEDGNTQLAILGGQWFSIGIYSDDSCCGRGFYSVEICESPGVCPG